MKFVDDSKHGKKNLTKGQPEDAGYDICCAQDFIIRPLRSAEIETLVKVQIPAGYAGIIKSRSGMVFKDNIMAIEGVIDCGYTGYIKVKLFNMGMVKKHFKAGDRIAQLVIKKIYTEKASFFL